MIQDPETVTLAQVRDAFVALGLDPVLDDVRDLRVDSREITITRYQRTGSLSRARMVGEYGGIQTETNTIRIIPPEAF